MIGASLRAGLRLLTCVPGGRGPDAAAAIRAAPLWFPAIGLLIGGILFAGMHLPIPPLPRAALVALLWVGLTGGLHEDGLHDCLDAALAPVSPSHRRSILKDPHIGSHALTGGVLHQILRFAALTAVPPFAVLAAPVIGRGCMALSLAIVRPARPDGLGARYAERPWTGAAIALTLICLIPAAWLGSVPRAAAACAVAAIAALLSGRFLARRFDGFSGDAHGAIGLVAETAALYAYLPLVGLEWSSSF